MNRRKNSFWGCNEALCEEKQINMEEKRMKKIGVVLLSLCLALTLTACAKSEAAQAVDDQIVSSFLQGPDGGLG